MSTARQRRRKTKARRCAIRNQQAVQSLRQRVTMEVARLANVLGMTLGIGNDVRGESWAFWGPDGWLLDYGPLNGRWGAKGRVGHEPDVRKVLEMAARIIGER